MKNKSIIILTLVFCFPVLLFADTLVLKNGKTVQGKVLEKTDKYIQLDFQGVPITYYFDEIQSATNDQGENLIVSMPSAQVEKLAAVGSSFEKGTAYLVAGQWPEAIAEFKSAIAQEPNDTGAHFNLGCAYALTGSYDQARSEFQKALLTEEVPYNAFCYFNIGGVYVKEALIKKNPELFSQAGQYFAKAAQALPNFILALDNAKFSHSIAQLGAQADKVKEFNFGSVEKNLPPDSTIFLLPENFKFEGENRGCFFDKQTVAPLFFYHSLISRYAVCISKKDLQNDDITDDLRACLNALIEFSQGKQLSRPDKIAVWNALYVESLYWLGKNEWDRGLGLVEKSQSLGLNYASDYLNAAVAYYKKEDYPKAKIAAQKALELNPEIDGREELERVIRESSLADNVSGAVGEKIATIIADGVHFNSATNQDENLPVYVIGPEKEINIDLSGYNCPCSKELGCTQAPDMIIVMLGKEGMYAVAMKKDRRIHRFNSDTAQAINKSAPFKSLVAGQEGWIMLGYMNQAEGGSLVVLCSAKFQVKK